MATTGAAIWLGVVFLRLASVPTEWWRWRDDAVITLSHARNLVDYGSIGVSPGGDRVEGFSSPVQFVLSALFFGVTDRGYEAFLDLQVVLCVGLSGALTALALVRLGSQSGLRSTTAVVVSLVLTTGTVGVIASSWTSIGWLVSGMENPLVLVAALGVLWLCLVETMSIRHLVGIGTAVAILGLVRVELAAMMGPTLVAVAVLVGARVPRESRRGAICVVLGIPLAVWAVTHVARWLYFGSLFPNTAAVQGKSFGTKEAILLAGISALISIAVVVLERPTIARRLPHIWRSLSVVAVAAGVTAGVFGFLEISQRPQVVMVVAATTGAAAALLAVNPDPGIPRHFDLVAISILSIPVLQFAVMGSARLETFRVFSTALPLAAFWLSATTIRLLPQMPRQRGYRQPLAHRKLFPLAVAAAAAGVGTVAAITDEARDMPFRITPSEEWILATAETFRRSELGDGPLPIVANPDLGKLSFAKQTLVVDLGFLGDPLLTRISSERPDLVPLYLNRVATPDVIESHQGWSCRYKEWIESQTFAEQWTLTADPSLKGEAQFPDCPLGGRLAIWVRSGASEELALTRQVATATDPVSVIADAIDRCVAGPGDVFRCQAVRRAVTRNSAILRREGLLRDVADVFDLSPSAALDKPLLLRGRNWWDHGFEALADLTASP